MLEQMIIAMAILLTLFHAELTESSSSCNKAQIKRVDENATAFVSCPQLEGNEKIFITLYKEHTKLHSTNLSDVDNNQSWQRFQVYIQNYSVSYMILRTKANDTGVYKCEIDTEDKKNRQSAPQILLIKDALPSTESSANCTTDQTLPLSVGCGVIFAYNVFITVFGCYVRHKLKNTELPENPYINTRPGGFRRR